MAIYLAPGACRQPSVKGAAGELPSGTVDRRTGPAQSRSRRSHSCRRASTMVGSLPALRAAVVLPPLRKHKQPTGCTQLLSRVTRRAVVAPPRSRSFSAHSKAPRRTPGRCALSGAEPALLVTAWDSYIEPAVSMAVQVLEGFGPTAGIISYVKSAPYTSLVIFLYATAVPGPLTGILDYYVLQGISRLVQRRWKTVDFQVKDQLGQGNFGTVYLAYLKNVSIQCWILGVERALVRENAGVTFSCPNENELDPIFLIGNHGSRLGVSLRRRGQSQLAPHAPHSVAHRQGTIRSNFLGGGTIASGAAESGYAEMYFNERMQRVAPSASASYLGTLSTGDTTGTGNFSSGQQWLIWRYESDATALDFLVSSGFPYNLEEYIFGKELSGSGIRRKNATVREVIWKILVNLQKMHKTGIVHRDVKPSNILITNTGKVKIIDFGAAADMRVGINFSPNGSIFDPLYCPPEQFVIPRYLPKSPSPFIASLLAPFLWFIARPDAFDMYSVGLILCQFSIPELQQKGRIERFKRIIETRVRTWAHGQFPFSVYTC
eukprot:scaffold2284_cov402-Prasinococcus_capsulatus_cf.AAC.7